MVAQSNSPASLPSFAELLLSVGSPSARPLTQLGDSSLCATPRIKKTRMTQGHRKKIRNVRGQLQGENLRHATTIGVLPDDVMLEIFDLCQTHQDPLCLVWKWHLLVHVCRRWRQIIFESPHRLNLQLLCTYGTPARKNLGIWPALPVVIDYRYSQSGITLNDEGNIITVLSHHDRVCFVRLTVTGAPLGKMVTVMQGPFPALRRLDISLDGGDAPVLPAEFLGGSAPCLQVIHLRGIPFPALPKLLLSATDLVILKILDIPPTGYISPKEMVAGLAALPRLETFNIGFQLATPRPDRIGPPLALTLTVLPSLMSFGFRGASEYLEDFSSQIHSPQLDHTHIDYLNQPFDFHVPQLPKFLDRSVGPKLTLFRHAYVSLNVFDVTVAFRIQMNSYTYAQPSISNSECLMNTIRCEGADWQVSHISQVLSHFSATINIVHLNLSWVGSISGRGPEVMDDVQWLPFLQAISTVQMLHVYSTFAGHVALALQGIMGEMVPEVLPSLHSICLVGQPASSIEKFVTARELCGRPVTVVEDKEFNERLKSYVRK